jgi:hypothetical protein
MTSRGNITLLTGLTLSLLFHFAVLVPFVVAAMTPSHTPRVLAARFDPEQFREPPEEEEPLPEDELALGIEESEASTFSWIGHEEYREHLAALAETEQASFDPEPAPPGAAPAQPVPTPPDTPAPEPTPETPTEPVEVAEAPEETTEPVETPEAETEIEAEPRPTAAAGLAEETGSLTSLTHWVDTVSLFESPEDPTRAAAAPGREADADPEAAAKPKKPEESAKPSPAVAASPPTAPPAPEAPGGAPSEPRPAADRADQESDATSVVDVDPRHWKAGQPLAAKGLQVKPRRPSLTALQSLTLAGRPPLCEIRFGRDGKPKSGTRVVESSGNRAFDDAITSSLYRWRATGSPLLELTGDQTINIRIRIKLTRR